MSLRAHIYQLALGSALWIGVAHAQPEPTQPPSAAASNTQSATFRIDIADLGWSPDALAYSDRTQQSLSFRARADHMLSGAALDLSFDAAQAATAFERVDVLLNGEVVQSIPAASLRDKAGQRHITFEPTLLASSNQLELRLLPAKGTSTPSATCKVPPGTWSALRSGTLLLSSLPLPLPNDLAQLPLPFFDDTFEHPQQVSFVLPKTPSEAQLKAAGAVAGWFALQGRRRLTFTAHVGELPTGDGVVIADGPEARAGLGLGSEDELTTSGLALVDNPRTPGRKLLVVYGANAELLQRAAAGLLRDGYNLKGAAVSFAASVDLPPLAAFEVPRWAAGTTLTLGALADGQPLKTSGGHAHTLRVPFRLSPDLFVWPRDFVTLDLAYEQGISKARGPAHLHVALNDKAIGTLPSQRRGRSQLRLPRSSLRGYNELIFQVSYDTPRATNAPTTQVCGPEDDDASAWVAFKPDSQLKLGDAHNYALLPDLQLFIYDGFPFTAQGDLRDTSVLLPEQPNAYELSSMLSLFAHFAAITGYAATRVDVRLGAVDPASLAGRDVLTIAEAERHPLLARYQAELPLALSDAQLSAQRPARSHFLKRIITGQLDDSELTRARHTLEGSAVGAVFALPAPWDAERSWVVVTASDSASLPEASALQGFAKGERAHNDLLLLQADQRYLFELGTQHGRGQVDDLLALRFWLSHAWVALAGLLLLAAVVWGVFARGQLAALARRRLDEANS
jgi:hypothetical protein